MAEPGLFRSLGVSAVLVLLLLPAPAQAADYNGGSITIADSDAPPTKSEPYPSSVTVSGEKEIVRSVSVRVSGFTHPFPEDLDLLLVGPSGQSVMLVSDAGSDPETDRNFTVNDAAPDTLPGGSAITGSFKPTNLDGGDDDRFPAPAPAGPYGESLSALAEPTANGTWSLYAVDDESPDSGSIANWQLRISSRDPWSIYAATADLQPPFGFAEDSGSVRVVVQRLGNDDLEPGGVTYSTLPFYGSPTPGEDYIPQTGHVDWGPGESRTDFIDIPVIDDAIPEPQESVSLRLTNATGDAFLGPDGYRDVIVSIAANDGYTGALPPLPVAALRARRLQRVLAQRGVVITSAPNVSGLLTATGSITVPRAAAASVRLKTVRRRAVPRVTATLKLGLPRKAVRTVRRALARRPRLTATVRLTLRDTLGRSNTAVKRIKLTR